MIAQEAQAAFVRAAGPDRIEFENQALSVGREFLPACAIAVLDGAPATAEYWQWLTSQLGLNGNRRSTVMDFAKQLASAERDASVQTSGHWSLSHTNALANHLGCRVRDLTESDVSWAEEAYAQECSR